MYEPVNRDNVLEGAKLAFGQPVETRYDFEKADVIVSLDADFLYAGFPGNVRYIRDFAKRRNPDGKMNRLYVIESTPTTTGAKADHRLADACERGREVRASAIGWVRRWTCGVKAATHGRASTQVRWLRYCEGSARSPRLERGGRGGPSAAQPSTLWRMR